MDSASRLSRESAAGVKGASQRRELRDGIIHAAERGLRIGDKLVAMGRYDLAKLLWQEADAEDPQSWEIHSHRYLDRASSIVEALNLRYWRYQRPSTEDQLLVDALDLYLDNRDEEVPDQVIERVRDRMYLSVLDIAALAFWPRMRGQTAWVEEIYAVPEDRIEEVTARAYQAVQGRQGDLIGQAHAGWQILCELPGFDQCLALTSAVLHVCNPRRMPVWDSHVERALNLLDLPITSADRPYAQFVNTCIELGQRIERSSELAAYCEGRDPTPPKADRALHVIGRGSFTPTLFPQSD